MSSHQEVERLVSETIRDSGHHRHGGAASWHQEYAHSAVVYVGNLDRGLSEGDVVCVMSQYGEVQHVDLVRDNKGTGASRGYAFVKYEDQRSTVLAVDNLNGARLLGRVLRVDHVREYRRRSGDHGDNAAVARECA